MGIEDFLSRLDPKTAKRVRTAETLQLEKIPFASYGLNKASGGGIPKNRMSLLYGGTSAGKSLLMMQTIAKAQKVDENFVSIWVDAEGTYDKKWAERLGVDNSRVIVIQSKVRSKIEEEITDYMKAGPDLVVVDSISDILPEAFIGKEGDLELDRKQLGAHAKTVTAFVNAMLYLMNGSAVVMLSQTTTEIGQTYTKQIPHGGKKILFASSLTIKLTSSGTDANQIKGFKTVGDKQITINIGREVDAVVEKNKVASPGAVCKYNIFYAGEGRIGIDVIDEVVKEAIIYGIISKAGAWFKWDGEQWQGAKGISTYFTENPERFEELQREIHMVETGEVLD